MGNQDVDVYSVQLKAGGNLSVNLAPNPSGTVFAPTLRLFNSSGKQLSCSFRTGSLGVYPSITTPSGQLLPVAWNVLHWSEQLPQCRLQHRERDRRRGRDRRQGDFILNVTPNQSRPSRDSRCSRFARTDLPQYSVCRTRHWGTCRHLHPSDIIGQEIAPDNAVYSPRSRWRRSLLQRRKRRTLEISSLRGRTSPLAPTHVCVRRE